MANQLLYMKRCLDLAALGAGTTSPNPMVGAVIVHNDKVMAEGYTSPYGGAHAEVNAINQLLARYGQQQARQIIPNSCLYVSLEPCAHQGKTPPCADLIVEMGFKQVVVACQDPFAKVNGLGIEKMRKAGVQVELGLLEKEAKWLNRRFFTRLEKHRPYVILKWAETLDGYFATEINEQKWISNKASKQLVHQWRSQEDAIMVGTNTALIDNPALTVREWKGRNPKRVLLDRDLVVPSSANIFSTDTETIIFNANSTDWKGHLKYVELENYDLYFAEMSLYQLHLMDIQSIIIEGGKRTLEAFIQRGLWDEARVFTGAVSWGEGMRSPEIKGELIEEISVGTDRLRILKNIVQ